jgi:ABC-type multidrug transport system fused ATPase/permease subunit
LSILWKIAKNAGKYKGLYIVAILSTLALTLVNLAAPRILTEMTSLVEKADISAALMGADMSKLINRIVALTTMLVGLYLLRILFRFLSSYLTHKAAFYLVDEYRVRIYDHIQNLSMSFFSDKQTGDLMSRVVNDTFNLESLFAHIIPDMVTNITTVLGVMAVLLTRNYYLALLTLIPVPLIMFAGWLFSAKVRPNFRVAQKALAQLNAKLQDNFSGVHEIQAFGQEDYERGEVTDHTHVYTHSILRALKLSAAFHPGVEFLSSVGTVIVVGVGGVLALKGQLTISDIVAFLLYLSLFYAPISSLAQVLENAQQSLAGAERVMDVLDTDSNITDMPESIDIGRVRGEITFTNVSFSYEKDVSVLKDISFSCKAGQMVALVGPTGVGKTTLTQLIPRFYDVMGGSIKIDGKDIRGVTIKSLRSNIAPVLQDTFLFNGSVIDNIRYADPGALDEAVVEAAKAARIHKDIMEMTDQYNTVVGERGVRLSGGQKQRIAIARAILRKAPIIMLDEATASVDVETEREIQSAINGLTGTRTIIAIAHRLSTIQSADLILVIDGGEIVQRGAHRELMEQEGLYRRLNLAQGNEIPEGA